MPKTLDLREAPSYRFIEAAHYLRIPVNTLRAWGLGQFYYSGRAKKKFQPIITLPESNDRLLSFLNLCEVHVLDAIRREHHISL
ncbi:MAG: hypothetical protein A2487_21550 [Candidatus Raymondbacteria bacterium RifOxyC12_full_50_8]|nr:MAG: hypothetical protein A2487_21550 [Candidatus Raymondbacteria bacterium RifOxyC12_full_50_8]